MSEVAKFRPRDPEPEVLQVRVDSREDRLSATPFAARDAFLTRTPIRGERNQLPAASGRYPRA